MAGSALVVTLTLNMRTYGFSMPDLKEKVRLSGAGIRVQVKKSAHKWIATKKGPSSTLCTKHAGVSSRLLDLPATLWDFQGCIYRQGNTVQTNSRDALKHSLLMQSEEVSWEECVGYKRK